MDTLLAPVEHPRGPFWKLSYRFMRRRFGKVMTPASVFSARMPKAFTFFYGKIGTLDKKLVLGPRTAKLIREQVSSLNGCLFCMDATRAAALEAGDDIEGEFAALHQYGDSPLFSASDRAALDYATELTVHKAVSPAAFAELSEHYSEREICDIVWLVASEHLYNLSNLGLNIGSDGLCDLAKARAA
jgi:AhpD family alkylhydroperoxidase